MPLYLLALHVNVTLPIIGLCGIQGLFLQHKLIVSYKSSLIFTSESWWSYICHVCLLNELYLHSIAENLSLVDSGPIHPTEFADFDEIYFISHLLMSDDAPCVTFFSPLNFTLIFLPKTKLRGPVNFHLFINLIFPFIILIVMALHLHMYIKRNMSSHVCQKFNSGWFRTYSSNKLCTFISILLHFTSYF